MGVQTHSHAMGVQNIDDKDKDKDKDSAVIEMPFSSKTPLLFLNEENFS
jgi:hypothetical protein